MNIAARNHANRNRRAIRTRAKLALHAELPRLSVHRTLRHIYAQVIDDTTGTTLLSASDHTVDTKKATKTESAKLVGAAIAAQAKEKKITNVRFDRGSFRYHGRVAALAESAREHGLAF
jgi:large subunit ribosomal protein L18